MKISNNTDMARVDSTRPLLSHFKRYGFEIWHSQVNFYSILKDNRIFGPSRSHIEVIYLDPKGCPKMQPVLILDKNFKSYDSIN